VAPENTLSYTSFRTGKGRRKSRLLKKTRKRRHERHRAAASIAHRAASLPAAEDSDETGCFKEAQLKSRGERRLAANTRLERCILKRERCKEAASGNNGSTPGFREPQRSRRLNSLPLARHRRAALLVPDGTRAGKLSGTPSQT
jgi:hypothetical protein